MNDQNISAVGKKLFLDSPCGKSAGTLLVHILNRNTVGQLSNESKGIRM